MHDYSWLYYFDSKTEKLTKAASGLNAKFVTVVQYCLHLSKPLQPVHLGSLMLPVEYYPCRKQLGQGTGTSDKV